MSTTSLLSQAPTLDGVRTGSRAAHKYQGCSAPLLTLDCSVPRLNKGCSVPPLNQGGESRRSADHPEVQVYVADIIRGASPTEHIRWPS